MRTRVQRARLRTRASRPMSESPRAFLRWAGSKRYLLPHLVRVLPAEFNHYYEPFLGSGSLFFLLEPGRATLSDACPELVSCFEAVRDHPEDVIEWFGGKKPDKEYFYHLRANRSADPVTAAAEFIYLNKTCWNGLYRVNSSGVFNVPYGRPKTDNLVDVELLRSCSHSLRMTDLLAGDFESAVEHAAEGDLVFLDPPYVTRHNNNGFVDYNQRLFSWEDQIRLANCARGISLRGAQVIVANALHEELTALYDGFRVRKIARVSTIASSKEYRGPVEEALYVSVH